MKSFYALKINIVLISLILVNLAWSSPPITLDIQLALEEFSNRTADFTESQEIVRR